MTDVLLILFAIWPVVGIVCLSLANRRIRHHGRGQTMGPARSFADVLARMYFWPYVLLRALRGAGRGRQHEEGRADR